MSINKTLLSKGIKYLGGAVPLLFIGPSVIYNAFMNKDTNWHYLVLLFGIFICFSAMYFLFSGLRILVQSIFND